MKRPSFLILPLLFFQSLAVFAASHAFLWSPATGMQDLGTLGGDISWATGINDNGQVCGNSYLADNATLHPFIWSAKSGMVDIGVPSAGTFRASAINSLGHIVGSGYFWSASGGFVKIGARNQGINGAIAINNRDEVTGTGSSSVHGLCAYFWKPGYKHAKYLGTYPGGTYTIANAINDLGDIVANGTITGTPNSKANDTPDVFLLEYQHETGWTNLSGIEFGTLPQSINNNNEIVGYGMDTFTYDMPFYHGSFGYVILKGLAGYRGAHALAINQNGEIAGFSCNPDQDPTRAIVWANYTSVPEDIGTLGGPTAYATALNNLGQVVGGADLP